MKQIKFRAFIKDIGVMCPAGALCFGRNYDLEGVSCHIPNGYVSTKNVADVYLMQYTGLKDKNGVEIYEGDVLYFEPYETHINDRVVQNIDGAYHGRLIRSGYSKLLAECLYETKVIGNIYENPELLEEKK